MNIKFLGKIPKVVMLPVPFVSYSSKTGQVCCNPIGEFSEEDGLALLKLSGEEGMFRLVEEVGSSSNGPISTSNTPATTSKVPEGSIRVCECGCGEPVNAGKRFVRGHHWKKKQPSQAHV